MPISATTFAVLLIATTTIVSFVLCFSLSVSDEISSDGRAIAFTSLLLCATFVVVVHLGFDWPNNISATYDENLQLAQLSSVLAVAALFAAAPFGISFGACVVRNRGIWGTFSAVTQRTKNALRKVCEITMDDFRTARKEVIHGKK